MRSILALGFSVLPLLACGGTDDPPVTDGAKVELGTIPNEGTGFAPLSGDVTLAPGAQGGFHVWLTYRVTGMPPDRVAVRHTARRASDGRLIVTGERLVDLGNPDDDGAWELPKPLPAFMCPTPIGVSVIAAPLRFLVEISDLAGNPLASGEASVTPHCPEDDQAAFCEKICKG